MTDITKKVSRLIPIMQRSQTFNQDDAIEGDVLMIKNSLGHSASSMIIETEDVFAFKLNVYHDLYPTRPYYIGPEPFGYERSPWLTSGQEIQDSSVDYFALDTGDIMEFSKDLPIDDMQVVAASGNWKVFVV